MCENKCEGKGGIKRVLIAPSGTSLEDALKMFESNDPRIVEVDLNKAKENSGEPYVFTFSSFDKKP